ncbi:rotatin-like isoform X3 [Halichondria panicea]|uniref:rotatin-like isoform X3 n=1 Tax=Halichondria panicea TaxID=6063 RepID=UPI00312BCAC4
MSAGGEENERPLRELLLKINHPLSDVRSRSLRSVSFKLSHSLVSVEELVSEREFLVGLLEWFNHEGWTCETQVLALLLQLTQNATAALTIVEVGGVNFLSQLRPHCNPALHPLIDDILEQLLRLPTLHTSCNTSTTSFEHPEAAYSSKSPSIATTTGEFADNESSGPTNGKCIRTDSDISAASSLNTVRTSDVGSYMEISRESFGLKTASQQPTLPAQYNSSHSLSGGSTQLSSMVVDSSQEVGETGRLGGMRYTESRVIPHGRDEESGDHGDGGVRGFPWVQLTDNDRGILLTTHSRLQSSTEDALVRSCEFLQDVLFQDFPAEILLQRPAIIKSLVRLLEGSGSTSHTLSSLLSCLASFTHTLHQRMMTAMCPSGGLRGRGGLSLDTPEPTTTHSTNPNPPETLETLTPEMLSQLQSEQLSTSQFSLLLISAIATLLPCLLANDTTVAEGGSTEAIAEGGSMEAIALCVELLCTVRSACEVMTRCGSKQGTVFSEGSAIPNPQIEGAVDSLCSALSQCLSRWRRLAPQECDGRVCPQLQVVCSVTIHLSLALCHVMEMSSTSSGVLPLPSALSGLVMNGVLGLVCPSLITRLLPTLERVDVPTSRLYHQVVAMTQSFHAMSQFLSPQRDVITSLTMATSGLEGLWFTANQQFIAKAIDQSLLVGDSPAVPWGTGLQLLLRLVGHGSDRVREHAYKHLREQYDIWLVSVAESADSDVQDHPLLNSDLLSELCCYGVVADNKAIADSACKICASLLSCDNEEVWSRVWGMVNQWMPFLECAMSESGVLCGGVQQLLEGGGGALTSVVRLRSLTRLLYSNSTDLRVWSFRQLSTILLEGNSPPPWLPTATTPLHNVLTLGKHHCGWTNTSTPSSFKHEDVLKLVRILRSASMDDSLKKSALEQLSLILRDQQLHAQVLQDDIITEDLLSALVLHSAPIQEMHSEPSQESARDLIVKPCIKCLLLLALSSPPLRDRVAQDATTLSAILRAALAFNEDVDFLSCVSMLLAMCLFRCVVMVTEDSQLQIPHIFAKKLKFPFSIVEYERELCHVTPSPLDPALFSTDPLLGMLRLAYHSIRTGPPDQLISAHQNRSLDDDGDHKMAVPSSDIAALSALSVTVCLQEYVELLRTASSHGQVVSVLYRIEVVLRNWTMCGGRVDMDRLQCDWRKAFVRFLSVSPSSTEDLSLLSTVLGVLQTMALVSRPRPLQSALCDHLLQRDDLDWLIKVTCCEGAVCLKLLTDYLQHKKQSDPQRLVLKRFLRLLVALIGHTHTTPPITPPSWLYLVETVCQCVQLAGSPDYYDLPLLEASLECLLHLSSCSVSDKLLKLDRFRKLLFEVMTALRQVLWSLISGRGYLALSFLGRGVTSRASLALAHVMQTASLLDYPKGWWVQWLESCSPDIGLVWLRHLVEDRDPQVRYSGLRLLSLLCSKLEVTESLLGVWRDFPCGLWGVCLEIALDVNSNDLVKQQALFVLVSLSNICNCHKKWSNYLVCTTNHVSTACSHVSTVCSHVSTVCNHGRLSGEKALGHLLHTYDICHYVNAIVQSDRFSQVSREIDSISKLTENIFFDQRVISNDSKTKNGGSDEKSIKRMYLRHSFNSDGAADVSGASTEGVNRVLVLLTRLVEICDPLFVCGVCDVLHNMASSFPQEIGAYLQETGTLEMLVRFTDVTILKLFISAAIRGIIRPHLLTGWVRMVAGIVGVVRGLLPLQPSLVNPLILRTGLVCNLWEALSAVSSHCLEDTTCLSLCSQVLELMLAAVQCNQDCSLTTITVVFRDLHKHWKSFVNVLLYSLKRPELCVLTTHALKALSLVLVHSAEVGVASEGVCAKSIINVKETLDQDYITADSENPIGWVLCLAIMDARDIAAHHPPPHTALTSHTTLTEALRLLLACSSSAKQSALANGLLESTMDQLKSLGSKVKSQTAQDHPPQAVKRSLKESPAMLEYISTVHVIRNFMYKSLEVKTAVGDCQLLSILHKQWTWYSLNKKTLTAVLKLLSVFTAGNSRGQALLCQPLRCLQLIPSLLHSSLKLCSTLLVANHKPTPHDMLVIGGLFPLITNCALSNEGRATLRKMNFLSNMSSLSPKSDKGQRSSKLATLWVSFLVNLSFSSDGQQMIMKQSGALEVVTDLYWSSSAEGSRTKTLLLLRNLSFYGPSKTLLATNEGFQSILSHCLGSEDARHNALASSALWALLHNCNKIRHVLKHSELVESLESLHSRTIAPQRLGGAQNSDNHLKTLTMAYSLLH